jgi:P-type E1-E2 ATPase
MSRRGVLSQQLNAIESLASVDTLCVDKTGTLTASALRVVEVLPALPTNEEAVRQVLGVLAATASARNLTLQAIADACPAESVRALREVPFSSRRRWSAVQMSDATYYLGAPGLISVDGLDAVAEERQAKGRRVVAVAQSSEPLATEPADLPPPGLQPLGIVVLAEELRPGVAETIAFLRREEVEVKVLSGDAPANRGRNRERRRHSGHRRQRGRGDSRGSGGAHGVRAPGDGGGTDLPGG